MKETGLIGTREVINGLREIHPDHQYEFLQGAGHAVVCEIAKRLDTEESVYSIMKAIAVNKDLERKAKGLVKPLESLLKAIKEYG